MIASSSTYYKYFLDFYVKLVSFGKICWPEKFCWAILIWVRFPRKNNDSSTFKILQKLNQKSFDNNSTPSPKSF